MPTFAVHLLTVGRTYRPADGRLFRFRRLSVSDRVRVSLHHRPDLPIADTVNGSAILRFEGPELHARFSPVGPHSDRFLSYFRSGLVRGMSPEILHEGMLETNMQGLLIGFSAVPEPALPHTQIREVTP